MTINSITFVIVLFQFVPQQGGCVFDRDLDEHVSIHNLGYEFEAIVAVFIVVAVEEGARQATKGCVFLEFFAIALQICDKR